VIGSSDSCSASRSMLLGWFSSSPPSLSEFDLELEPSTLATQENKVLVSMEKNPTSKET